MIAARDLSVSYYLKLIPIDPVCHMLSNEYPGKATFRKIHKLSMIVCVYATYDANEGGESHFDVIGVIIFSLVKISLFQRKLIKS